MAKKRIPPKATGLTFETPVLSIRSVDQELAARASRPVNVSLTLRNGLIGCYVVDFELRGADRAQYGEKLLAKLSTRLLENGVSRTKVRELRRDRRFYQTYPRVREA